VKDENAIGEEIVRFVEGRIGEGGLVNWSGFFFCDSDFVVVIVKKMVCL
jgi:hypothetical protein